MSLAHSLGGLGGTTDDSLEGRIKLAGIHAGHLTSSKPERLKALHGHAQPVGCLGQVVQFFHLVGDGGCQPTHPGQHPDTRHTGK